MSISSAPSATASSTSRELQLERALPGRERRRDRRDLDAAAGEPLDGGRDEVRVDADGGDRRARRVGRVGPDRLRAERRDLAGRVLALERRQVAAADRERERPELRLPLDAALGELRGALLDADLVDRADPRQPLLQRQLESGRQGGRLRHRASVAPARSQDAGPGGRRNVSAMRRAGARPQVAALVLACLLAALLGGLRRRQGRHDLDDDERPRRRRRSGRPPTSAR